MIANGVIALSLMMVMLLNVNFVQSELLGNLCTDPCENTPCANENFDGEKGTCLTAGHTFALNTCVNQTGTVPEFKVTFQSFSLEVDVNATKDTYIFRLFDQPMCPNGSAVYHATVNRIDCGVIGNMTWSDMNSTVFRAVAVLDTSTDWVYQCDAKGMATWKVVLIVIGSSLALAFIVIMIVRGRRQVKSYESI
jgi:hypothetical protein